VVPHVTAASQAAEFAWSSTKALVMAATGGGHKEFCAFFSQVGEIANRSRFAIAVTFLLSHRLFGTIRILLLGLVPCLHELSGLI
jgi:hypothetical protein